MLVSAVSYLNTWPLVWGFLHGAQKGVFNFRFDLPAHCAAALERGDADIGLVPCAELDRLRLDFLPELGIACDGPVRSILLISKCPYKEIRTLAADAVSKTSVALARILLAERFGCPSLDVRPHSPHLDEMLAEGDAALIIGDPALRLDPAALPYRTLDLGEEWRAWTGLPMVFAVWAVRRDYLAANPALVREVHQGFLRSRDLALDEVDKVAAQVARWEVFDAAALERYFTTLDFSFGPRQLAGAREFARQIGGQIAVDPDVRIEVLGADA